MLLLISEQSPAMLLNILQGTGPPPPAKKFPTWDVNGAEAVKPWSKDKIVSGIRLAQFSSSVLSPILPSTFQTIPSKFLTQLPPLSFHAFSHTQLQSFFKSTFY